MTVLRIGSRLPVSDASSRGVSRLVREAGETGAVLLTSHNQEVGAVIAKDDLDAIEHSLEDLADLALVLARAASDSGERTGIDDVLAAFGHTRESLAQLPDEDE